MSGPIKTCPTCGQANPASDDFCTGCGRPLADVPAVSPKTPPQRSLPLAVLLQRDATRASRREPEVGGAGYAWLGVILTGIALAMSPESDFGKPLWAGGILLALFGFWRMRRNRHTLARAGLATMALALVTLTVVGAELLDLRHPGNLFGHHAAVVLPATATPDWLGPTPTPTPAQQTADEASVPMFRGDAERTGAETGPGPLANPNILWKLDTTGEIYSSAAVANGTVYIGTKSGYLLALDAATGDQRWQADLGDYIVRASPAVADGSVYVGAGFSLVALDASNGKERWRFQTRYAGDSSPAVVAGTVYVGTQEGYVYAVDAQTGIERWHFEADGLVFSSPAVADGSVFFGSDDGNLYAVDAKSGQQLWRFPTGGEIYSSPAVSGATVYISSTSHYVYAVDAATGQQLWRYGVGGDSSPAVVGGTVYLGGDDGGLYALDARTGKVRWLFATGSAVASSPVVSGTAVYVGSGPTVFAVAARTGKALWSFGTRQPIQASPAVAGGRLFIGSRDGYLYALTGSS